MQAHCLNQRVLASGQRLALPIAVAPGVRLSGGTVRDLVTNPVVQCAAQAALHERYHTSFLLSAMDLSAEAEAFGCAVAFSDTEVPTVTGQLVTSSAEAQKLSIPKPGDGRTRVYLETVQGLRKLSPEGLVFAGCIGPFSLAARLVGVSEALELTLTEPACMECLIDKSAQFLAAYIQAFRESGADGVIVAEPAAGLLSPKALALFSSQYVRQIAVSIAEPEFAIVLHNCAAKLVHLPAILQSGLSTFHFGAPMDLPAALTKVSAEVVLCGNLDPTAVFCQPSATEVEERTTQLLTLTAAARNFVISSGCDLPASAKLENLDAFYKAVSKSSSSAAV